MAVETVGSSMFCSGVHGRGRDEGDHENAEAQEESVPHRSPRSR